MSYDTVLRYNKEILPERRSNRHHPEIVPRMEGLKSPEHDLKITYVIPIRGEIKNGNFFSQLNDFTNQREIEKTAYEVIYVVNNPKNNDDIHNKYIFENDLINQSIQYIQGEREHVPYELAAWEEKIVKRARQNRLRVHNLEVVDDHFDKSEFGNTIEGVRIAGENAVKDRFQALGRDGVIVTFDADTRLGVHTTRQIQEQLYDQPDVSMLRIFYDLHPTPGEGTAEHTASSAQERFFHTCGNIQLLLDKDHMKGWYAIKAQALEKRSTRDTSLSGLRETLGPTTGQVSVAQDIKLYV